MVYLLTRKNVLDTAIWRGSGHGECYANNKARVNPSLQRLGEGIGRLETLKETLTRAKVSENE